MSHPDPYGAAEPRGWDRPAPAPLPWPESDLEPNDPWRRPAGPDTYAPGRSRPGGDPHPRPADGYAPPEHGRSGEPRRPEGPGRRSADRDRAGHGEPGHDDPRGRAPHADPHWPDHSTPFEYGNPGTTGRDRGPAGPGARGRGNEPGYVDPAGGRAGGPDDDYPTARIAPVRDEPTGTLPPFRDEPTGRFDPVGDHPSRPGGDDRFPPGGDDPFRSGADDPSTRFGPAPDEPATTPPAGRRRGRRRASAERPPTVSAPTGRAGRNLPAAIGVGVVLGAAVVVPLFFYRPAFLVVVAAAMGIGIWEMARAVRRSGAYPPLVPLVAGGVITVCLGWFAGPDALSLGLLVTVLGTMIWRLGDGPGNYQRDLTAAALIAVYVPFLGGFAAMLAAASDGHLRVLVTLVAVVLSDTGGYAAGVAFGKHPMAPTISPKKSWEGFAGSVTAAAVGSALLLWLLFDVAPWWGALFGVAMSCAAVLGDLAESMIKRDLGVKDMSNLLPGHGGLMDRLDSILFAVPTAYLLLAVFVPVVV
ncbi:phosphatidate cytidylyltransferase [Micromonospora auratinigra]|uniref:Phosphatidate cytidylyltransferase n=1 Tax=Micromonospora auratinigra TaxID=261654 RepID=A0A1A9A9T5_9ACTN|nr:phosphatidate cytidylyltransferase [Micromonospora auratinigra]SBT53231.1 phosphatidate cytidylyltransferase [Micromonospora auratinigra]